MTNSNLIRSGLAAVLVLGAAMAQAQTVTLTGFQYGGNTVYASGPSGLSDWGNDAGAFKGSLSGFGAFDTASFTTYCVDMSQFFSFSKTPMTGYSLISGASDTQSFAQGGWGANAAATSARLGQLMTYVNAHPTAVNSAAESTALQLAIWNVIYDTDNTVSKGDFSVAWPTDFTYGATADALLSASLNTTSNLSVSVLHSTSKQDFLVVSSVPEPSTYALMLAGLGGIGFIARRRRAAR